ncbi:MAG: extracellular solute-binding protein [Anaerolineae bacterium]|jgi:ABC-type glycerol-3-phosphate transport system substrate-binding protein
MRSGVPWLSLAVALLLAATAVVLSGCDLFPTEATAVPGAATGTPAPPALTAAPTMEVTEPAGPGIVTLTMWTTERFSPTQAITSGQIVAQQVEEFEAAHQDTRLAFVLKKPYGKGGVLDYLLTTGAVVPELMPDLAILDVDELGTAVQSGLVQPLDGLIAPDLVGDLYPFARAAATFDDQLMGLQFETDMEHLVYNAGQLTVPPRSWPGVLSNPGTYVFAAGGQGGLVNDSFLIQYLAVWSWPGTASPDGPFLDENSLTAVLQYYQDGVTRGVFPPDVLDYHSTEDCWQAYQAGEADLAQVSAHRYLLEREALEGTVAAPIPAINGAASAIGDGWVLVLVATEPSRQSLAAEFMARLMAPQINAAWSRATGYLPTRQAALADVIEADSYYRFADEQLERAQPRPRLSNYAQLAAALQRAVEDVVSGAATPEEAAARVVENNP